MGTDSKKSLSRLFSYTSLNEKDTKSSSTNFSTAAHISSLQSFDVEGKIQSPKTDSTIFEKEHFSDRLTNFIFESQSKFDDFDEITKQNRQERLQKYCLAKAKKWFNKKKKYNSFEDCVL